MFTIQMNALVEKTIYKYRTSNKGVEVLRKTYQLLTALVDDLDRVLSTFLFFLNGHLMYTLFNRAIQTRFL